MKLSICYIVKDEAMNLPESIFYNKGLEAEICIIDTGSTDGTKEYAKAIADKYADFKWCDDFSAARNASLELATGDWILVMDADEWINGTEHLKVLSLIESKDRDGFFFTIWNFLKDPRWVNTAKPMYGKSIRLFKNNKGYKYEDIVHNKLNMDKDLAGNSNIGIINMNFKERFNIEWKCEQNKRLMDIKIADQGWSFLNYVHYSDIYRKLWVWKRRIEDGKSCVYYLNLALKEKFSESVVKSRNKILEDMKHVRFQREGAEGGATFTNRVLCESKIQG